MVNGHSAGLEVWSFEEERSGDTVKWEITKETKEEGYSFTVLADGKEIRVSGRQLPKLFEHFLRHPGTICSRYELKKVLLVHNLNDVDVWLNKLRGHLPEKLLKTFPTQGWKFMEKKEDVKYRDERVASPAHSAGEGGSAQHVRGTPAPMPGAKDIVGAIGFELELQPSAPASQAQIPLQTGSRTAPATHHNTVEPLLDAQPASKGYVLLAQPTPVGREKEILIARDRWLKDRNRPLLINGPAGIGKSTLALAILHHPDVVKKFYSEKLGARRYRMPCDRFSTVDDMVSDIGRKWFGFDSSVHVTQQQVLDRLREAPSAVLLDNYETLLWNKKEARASIEWLANLLGTENVWLMVGAQGEMPSPAVVDWAEPVVPTRLPLDRARELFCKLSRRPQHANDLRLDQLLNDMDGVPRAIELLAAQARYYDDLSPVIQRWQRERTEMLQTERGDEPHNSVDLTYDFALSNPFLEEADLRFLRVVAFLPAGIAEADCEKITTGGTKAVGKLFGASLLRREAGRLQMLAPQRAYLLHRDRRATKEEKEGEKRQAINHFLYLACEANDIGRSNDSAAILARMLEEYQNCLAALHDVLSCEQIEAATGLMRFSGWTGIAIADAKTIGRRAVKIAGDQRREAQCVLGLAEIARFQDNDAEGAGSLYNEARDRARKAGDQRTEAQCVLGLAAIARFQDNDAEGAGSLYNEARDRARKAGDQRTEAQCVLGLAAIARFQDNDAEGAGSLYNEARDRARKAGDQRTEAQCVLGLAEIARFQDNDAEGAGSLYNEARDRARKAGDQRTEAQCVLGLAAIARFQDNDAEGAGSLYNEARDRARKAGDQRTEADCVLGLAEIARLQDNDAEGAGSLYNEARDLARKAGDQRIEADCVLGLAEIARFQDNDAEGARRARSARSLYNEARDRARKAGDQRREAQCVWGLAAIARFQDNDAEGARSLYNEARDLARKAGDQRTEAQCVLGLTAIARVQDNDAEGARSLYNEARDLARKAGDQRTEAQCVLGLTAIARFQDNDAEGARNLYNEARDLARKAGDQRTEAQCVLGLAAIAWFQDNDAEGARSLYNEARDLARKAGDKWLEAACIRSLARTTLRDGPDQKQP